MRTDSSPLRTTFNLLVTGHTSERLGKGREPVLDALGVSLDAIRDALAAHGHRRLRIWTGLSEGADSKAIEWAQRNGAPLYCVAATTSYLPKEIDRNHAHLLAISDKSGENYQDPLWVQASDEYKLSMADAVVAVWDGEKARGGAGGVVRIMAEALRRRVPILWIDLNGNRRLSAPFGPDVPSQARLDLIDALVPETMIPLFGQTLSLTDPNLQGLFSQAEFAEIHELMGDLFDANDDPGERPRLAGYWHTGFFRLLTPWKRLWEVRLRKKVDAYRGKDVFVNGSGLDKRFWENIFDPLDRVATHAADRYRDSVVLTHLSSSLAVLGAVAGIIGWLGIGDWPWALLELVTLVTIVVLVRRGNPRGRRSMRDLFLETRRAAERLRISALLYPFLASLPELHRGLWQVTAGKSDKKLELSRRADWLVLQALRDAEPPLSARPAQETGRAVEGDAASAYILSEQKGVLIKHLKSFIVDQAKYHCRTAEKNELTFHRLHRLTQSVYYLVLAVVVVHVLELVIDWKWHDERNPLTLIAHFLAGQHWVILITAFFPALAAALHGILSTLELKRIAHASKQTALRLMQIEHSLKSLKPDERTPIVLRAHALLTAQTAFAEHDRWSNLMEAQNLSIPA